MCKCDSAYLINNDCFDLLCWRTLQMADVRESVVCSRTTLIYWPKMMTGLWADSDYQELSSWNSVLNRAWLWKWGPRGITPYLSRWKSQPLLATGADWRVRYLPVIPQLCHTSRMGLHNPYVAPVHKIFLHCGWAGIKEKSTSKRNFAVTSWIPNLIRAIDCTLISRALLENELCVYRKQFHSISVQLICKVQMCLTNVVARWPGSIQDSFILCSSSVGNRLEAGAVRDGWLLGTTWFELYNSSTTFVLSFKRAVKNQPLGDCGYPLKTCFWASHPTYQPPDWARMIVRWCPCLGSVTGGTDNRTAERPVALLRQQW